MIEDRMKRCVLEMLADEQAYFVYAIVLVFYLLFKLGDEERECDCGFLIMLFVL